MEQAYPEFCWLTAMNRIPSLAIDGRRPIAGIFQYHASNRFRRKTVGPSIFPSVCLDNNSRLPIAELLRFLRATGIRKTTVFTTLETLVKKYFSRGHVIPGACNIFSIVCFFKSQIPIYRYTRRQDARKRRDHPAQSVYRVHGLDNFLGHY